VSDHEIYLMMKKALLITTMAALFGFIVIEHIAYLN
jgi:hypothetical protein|tara:strand:- start:1 stop:108 length:108 start_codon:yes stop_codon:yes gene_type:complete